VVTGGGASAGTTCEPARGQAPVTVDMDLHEVGRLAAERLLRPVNGRSAHGLEDLPCKLLAREPRGVQTPSTYSSRQVLARAVSLPDVPHRLIAR